MSAISMVATRTEELSILLGALLPRTAANGPACSAAAAVLERLRRAEEATAIDAEDVLAQAEEALCLG